MSNQAEKKNRATDVILVLKPKVGLMPKNSGGLTDTRLFTRENNLHAKMDIQTCLWHLEYDKGELPPIFKQKFTGLTALLKFVTAYYNKRNVEIVDMID